MDIQEVLYAIRNGFGNALSSTAFWFKKYRPWVFSGLTVVTILLVVWARFGFTFEIGQFFAAEPSSEGVLTVQCGTTSNTLTWTYDSSADSNSLQRGNEGTKNTGVSGCADYWCWLPSETYAHQIPTANTPATYTDTQIDEDVCYGYRVKYQAQVPSNTVYCPSNCNSGGTPPPTPEPIECAPASQTVLVGEEASLTAAGGSGDYFWDAPDGEPDIGAGVSFDVTFEASGTYEVGVLDNQDESGSTDAVAICEIVVQEEETSTPTPEPGEVTMSARVRNFNEGGDYRSSASGRPSQQFQVRVTINAGSPGAENVILSASLPDTVTYLVGSTTIDDSPTSVDTVTTSGLGLGDLDGRTEITYMVQARSAGQLPSGTLTSLIPNTVSADGGTDTGTNVTLIINNASVVQPPSQVPTGPADVSLLALMGAALVTMLYVTYTHTGLYRSREVSSIAKDKDRMDYRS